MKKFLSIIITVLLITGSSIAEIVDEIQIRGNKRVSDETVKVYGEIKSKGSDFSNADINNILKNLYSTNFFEDVNVEIRNKKLIINLIEYPVINEIVLIGEQNTRVQSQIKKIISSKEKNSFIKNNLNNDINLIVSRQSFSRLKSLLEMADTTNYQSLEGVTGHKLEPGKCYLIEGDLSVGWNVQISQSTQLRVFTDFEIFGVSRSTGNWQSANEKRHTGYKSLQE